MSRKIFTAIWGAALAVFAASLVFIMGVSYNYFTGVQMKQLHAETALAAQGVSLCGRTTSPAFRPATTASPGSTRTARCSSTPGRTPRAWKTISSARRSARRSRTARARRAATPHACRPPALRRAASAGRDGAPSRSCSSRSGRLCSGFAQPICLLWRCSRLGSRSCSPRGSQKNRRAHQCH